MESKRVFFVAHMFGLNMFNQVQLFFDATSTILSAIQHVCQGLNSHYFHIIGDGHQPNSRGLYTHSKDSY